MSLADQSQQWLTARAKVSVLQARGLRIKGKLGSDGAHALLQVGAQKFSTVRGPPQRADPEWEGQDAAFDLTGFPESGATLRVQVLQRALVGPDKLLGQTDIDLGHLYTSRGDRPQWFRLFGKPGKPEKDRGEILLDIQFLKGSLSASMFDLSSQDKSRSKLGKLKDKLRGRKREGLSDSASAIVPSVTQVMTDSEEEEEEEQEQASGEKKKKNKFKSLFAPKSSLQRNMSQSMSTLSAVPERDSAIASSTSSGLNAESPEGKKKFKLFTHKRNGSTDSKASQGGLASNHSASPSICINGSHVYSEELETKGSTLSLDSSGHGSMEELRREREEKERLEEERRRTEAEEERRRAEKDEEERKRKEREAEEERRKIEEEKERLRMEREKEEQRRKIEEEKEMMRLEREKEEQRRKIEEEKEMMRLEREKEEQRRKIEEDKEMMRLEREKEEQRRKMEEEKEMMRLEREKEEQRRKIEEEKERMRMEREKEEERRKIKERERKAREAEEERRKIEGERERKERVAEDQRRKMEEERERLRLEREKEEERRKMEEERERKEREAEEQRKLEEQKERMRMEKEEQRRKIEGERKEREAEEQGRKIEEEKERMKLEREKEEQRRKMEEEEKEMKRAEEKERRVAEEKTRAMEEEKRRMEMERRLAEEKKLREVEERKRKEEAEKQRREDEERERKRREEEEKERLETERREMEKSFQNLVRFEDQEKKENERKLEQRPVPKARRAKEDSSSKPEILQENTSTNPFEQSTFEEPSSTNPFEEPTSSQPLASVRSARVSAVKPSASISGTVSLLSVVNTNPFLDDDDSVDGSLEDLGSLERSERTAKKGRAPLPPQNKPEIPRPTVSSRVVPVEEPKQYSPLKEMAKRQAPLPPGSLRKTTEETVKGRMDQSSVVLDQGVKKPIADPEKHLTSNIAPISKDELQTWCVQSMKARQGQNSAPQKMNRKDSPAIEKQNSVQATPEHTALQSIQSQPSKKQADTNPFTCGGPATAKHNKGPAPPQPSNTRKSIKKELPNESIECTIHAEDKGNTGSEESPSNLKLMEKPKSLDGDTKSELADELSSKGSSAEPLQDNSSDNHSGGEESRESLDDMDNPKSLQLIANQYLHPDSLIYEPEGLPQRDSIVPETGTLTRITKKKSQAPLPPVKPKRVGDPGSTNQALTTTVGILGNFPESQSNKNNQGNTMSSNLPSFKTSSSMFVPLAEASEVRKVCISVSADAGSGSGLRTLPCARVVPSDTQGITGEVKGAGGAPASVIRPHAVKPLNAGDKEPDLSESNTSRAAVSSDHMQLKMEAAEPAGKGPYSQLTRAELISLVVRQQEQLSQRDSRISQLEQYIDNLLVRVMEENPSILMSINSKAV